MSRTPLQPARWDPPEAPALEGRYAPNTALDAVERLTIPDGRGPEDVVVDADGRVYTGIEDGRILAFDGPGARPVVVSATYGRPLGIELDAGGHLIVADAYQGLLRIDPVDGTVEKLVTSFLGRPLKLTNNATVASSGTIYFTESTDRFDLAHYKRDLFEHRPSGRVLAYHPDDGQLELIADGLHFANGVALAGDESWLAVCETGEYRITRVWLTGPDAGRKEPLIENLPGFPDNLSHNGAGVFWAPLASRRQKPLDALLPRPALRKLVDRLPESLQPAPERYAIVLGVDEDGQVVHNLHGPSGAYAVITGVREHDGWLYLGSLVEDAVGRVRSGSTRAVSSGP
ncbi:MAG TPA: SMP-30/gluconolactonase/LRE family protein [Nitriliruptorales bacterium]